jgi:DNA replication protein DnaC
MVLIRYFNIPMTWRSIVMSSTTTKSRQRQPKQSTASHRSSRSAKPAPNATTKQSDVLIQQFRELRLPMFREHFQEAAQRAEVESLSHTEYLGELTELECQARRESRISRLMYRSQLASSKRWDNFDWTRLPLQVARQMESLRDGSFLGRRENLLIFGKPGSGKSHCLCALGEQLVQQGHSILFTTCSLLVQQLLIAKRDLRLPKLIKKLSGFEGLIIDDLGYVQQSREEMEVLFTLLAERYERGSVMLTSNLPFSKWEQIFKDAMTTAAAIDRLVHHSVILELNVPSYRLEKAKTPRGKTGSATSAAQKK